MYIKRTLIVSKIGDEDKKSVAYIFKDDEKAQMIINFQEDASEVFALVRYANSPIEIVLLNRCADEFCGDLPQYFDCSSELFVCVIQVVAGKPIPNYIGGGKSQKQEFYNEIVKNLSYYYKEFLSIKGDKNLSKDYNKSLNESIYQTNKDDTMANANISSLFEEASDSEIDDAITDSLLYECLTQKDKCENCIYKKAFYDDKNGISTAKNTEKESGLEENYTTSYDINSNDIVIEAINNSGLNDDKTNLEYEKNTDFYNQIKKSLDALFDFYQRDEILEDKIENGHFVKVDYEDTGDYYSVGFISDGNTPKYICYAIPCRPGSPPPQNMESFSQYLPIDDTRAYYLMYQNASDGQTIEVA